MKTFIEKVSKIQATLKAPKSQFNKFGNYAYRNAEDILEAVKPLLAEAGLVLTITDELIFGTNENYIKAIATITDGTNTVTNSALAREASEQKGMNPAQITGSTSSYARKYALNGLFLIDDTKDADATNTHGKEDTFKSQANKAVATAVKTIETEIQAGIKQSETSNATKAKGFTAFKKTNVNIADKSNKGDMY